MTPRQAQLAILAMCLLVALVVVLGLQGVVWLVLTIGTAYFFADTTRWRENGQWRLPAFVTAAMILLTWIAAVWVYLY